MMRKFRNLNHWLAVILIAALVGCQSKTHEKTKNGIIVPLEKNKIRFQVFSKDVIRVTVAAADTFSTEQSMVVLEQEKPFSAWTVEENAEEISIKTSALKATLILKTGEVIFRDSTGNVLLEERKGGGKAFTPVMVEGKNYYSIHQVFESPDDEAFYGLGQHQFGYMNHKGKDVQLAQHNMDVAVPFVYSDRNYGLLWDNSSVTRFGDPREYGPITDITLLGKDGSEGGLTATYYAKDKVVKVQRETQIDYSFLETPALDTFPKDVANDGKVVWEGFLTSEVEGKHKFLVYGSGYYKIWIEGQLLMDKWRQNWNPWYSSLDVDLLKGQKKSIKIEWIPQAGFLGLTYLSPQTPEEQNRLSLFSEVANEIDYYFVRGDHADDVIKNYRAITGKAPIVPKWAMGFWQSRERYKEQSELLETVKTFRKKQIPLDNIVLDWFYWPQDSWGSHKFDSTRFPDPKGMVDELHAMNTRLMISVWPKFYPTTDNYEEMHKHGYVYQRNIEKKRLDWVGPGYLNTFYDPFSEGARKMFWAQIDRRLNVLGIDAWWLDASEPDIHSNLSMRECIENMSPTATGPGAKNYNAYPLMNAKGVYEEHRKTNPEKRAFILTRSAFAGQQRFGATTWSGDVVSRWSDFREQISAGVNFSLTGIPYWTSDIGGFAVEKRYENPSPQNLDEWRELNTRWYQFGAFSPIFRVHGQYPFREIYNIAPEGHPAYSSMLYYNKLRYRLMPYFYTLAGKAYHDDYTIMRGLVMDFGKDKNVLDIDDQFMAGPALLINPVTEYKARERNVYLPASTNWYDLYTGKWYAGGKNIEAQASYTTMPVYVREGAILPAGQDMQYTNEKPDTLLTVYVYGGQNGSFDLYSDEGINYNYENGEFAVTPLSYNEATGTFTIGKRKGSYKGMPEKQTIRVVYIHKAQALAFGDERSIAQTVVYTGDALEVKLK
jgi:alpha-D-xyloside xylohydrolase